MVAAFQMQFVVRPLQGLTNHDGAFRICLSPKAFDELRLKTGDLCSIHRAESFVGTVVAWRSKDAQLSKSVVQVSDILRDTFGLKIGDNVTIEKNENPIVKADTLYVKDVTAGATPIAHDDYAYWEWLSCATLHQIGLLAVDFCYEVSAQNKERRTFKITSIVSDQEKGNPARYRCEFGMKVLITTVHDLDDGRATLEHMPLILNSKGIGGLQAQLEQIQEALRFFNADVTGIPLPEYYKRGGGILLYGHSGTGKTLLLEKIAQASWRKVLRIDISNSEKAIRGKFAEALAQQPSLIIMDDLETYAGRAADRDSPSLPIMASILAAELKNITSSKVLVVGAAIRLDDVHQSLRTFATFGDEIEIPIPDANARAEIMKVIMQKKPSEPDALIDDVAETLHGFVGSDLKQLVMKATKNAWGRCMNALYQSDDGNGEWTDLPNGHINGDSTVAAETSREQLMNSKPKKAMPLTVEREDFEAARLLVRPTAMKEIFLETPKVLWSDIGGLHEIKKTLRATVEGRFKHPDRVKRLGYDTEKGILLYGPPGCSKTLIAKALATEAGLNFIAVKGAELVNMYVGESERAVREVFRKARKARPSIVFFDEIDAIASSRDGPSHTSGLNIVTTLLNEMDGIEEMRDVLVVAATNKPEILDTALMRPGRFDLLQYVGPPDDEARKEILEKRTRSMDVAADVDISELARLTQGCSGAELVRICHFAGKVAFEECVDTGKEEQIHWRHFESAISKTPKQITNDMIDRYMSFASRGGVS